MNATQVPQQEQTIFVFQRILERALVAANDSIVELNGNVTLSPSQKLAVFQAFGNLLKFLESSSGQELKAIVERSQALIELKDVYEQAGLGAHFDEALNSNSVHPTPGVLPTSVPVPEVATGVKDAGEQYAPDSPKRPLPSYIQSFIERMRARGIEVIVEEVPISVGGPVGDAKACD